MNPIQRAIDALMEARQDIENWAWFSTEEIRKQYDLDSMLHRVDADIVELRQALAHEALDRMVAENQRLGLYDDQQPVDLAKVGEVGVWGENGRLGLYEDEPVKRDKLSWVGLTEDELEDLEFASMDKKYGHLDVRVLSRAIEAKLKEKNNA